MGLIFVLGQANEYRMQVHDGNTISRTGYGSVFFLTDRASTACTSSAA